MPPKQKLVKASTTSSTSRDLVPVGPRELSTKAKSHGKRDENGEKPTTARALILRDGKHGARGTGELIHVTKLIGREKLDLLAEDLAKRYNQALMSPFRLEQCLKITESQCNSFLDDITNLRDPQLFLHIIQEELNSRTERGSKKGDTLKNSSFVASVVATRIHNSYMLASAWKLVSESLLGLAEEGLTDGTIKPQLKKNSEIRARYLALYDLVNMLVTISQAKFSVLATTTPHYARYFKQAEDSDANDSEIIFDWKELREACLSFLDSIIIELCFPRAPYPRAVLYQVLRDAVEESPQEAKRFPQALWDAVGDLSVCVELQQLLEAPLVGPEGQSWKAEPREMPEEYERWIDAQIYSEKASEEYGNYKDIIFPLEKTRVKGVLDNMWKYVNLNYKTVSGDDIDTLWRVNDALKPTPQWHSFYMPDLRNDSDDDGYRVPPHANKKAPKVLAIANSAANNSDDSMPDLQSVSNSSDEFDSDDDDSDDDDSDDDDEESGYDTEGEDDIRDKFRAAMDVIHEAAMWKDANIDEPIDPLEEEYQKGNYFLKALGSLRGRAFPSNPKLKTTSRKEPRYPKLGRIFNRTTVPLAPVQETKEATQKPSIPLVPKNFKTTVEDVQDEGDVPVSSKKKKKKYKKKKQQAPNETQQTTAVETPKPPPMKEAPRSPPPSAAKAPISPPTSPKAPAKKPTASPAPLKPTSADPTTPYGSLFGSTASPASPKSTALHESLYGSTATLPLPIETAQSARSYIQAENLDTQKNKVKSRPGHATVFSKLMGRGKTEEEPKQGAKHSWFSRLGKKTTTLMHQLLNTSDDDTKGLKPMKWDDFLRIMREMGFQYEPGTAGSSVRFDPPDPRDMPITFHKPHPDPTLHPIKLKDFAKRLKRHYGWTEGDFMSHARA